ncbi:MAG: YbaK/EbsC family protein [Deltaproteobacteria bacterium]|nr:YbaK/EbsC family protein [Deltaproteobacteria bacterium]
MEIKDIRDRVSEVLAGVGIDYKMKPHKRPVYTSVDAARERGVALEQIVKTMILADKSGRCVVALLPGDRRLNIKKIGRLLGGKFQLMSADEVRKATGFVVGAISPVGLIPHGWEIVADTAVFENEWVDISSGDPAAGIELRSADILKLIKCRVEDISR